MCLTDAFALALHDLFSLMSTTIPNDVQQCAIRQVQGPCLILAGPGSGKTYVLTHRVVHLLKEGVLPSRVLVLTFTNKAAREMKGRIEEMVGEGIRYLWVGTFHSLFARILRIESEVLGFPRDFTIYDQEDSKRLIKKIISELKLDEEVYKLNVVLRRISSAKNRLMLDAQGYQGHVACQEEDAAHGKPHLATIFAHYEGRCKRAFAMDFDDLLLATYQLFHDHSAVLEKYAQRFQYLLVDESQDMNGLQYVLVKRLAGLHGNVCLIGDDAQAIYAFRGADVGHILSFERDFPGAVEIRLTQNYRSTKRIVRAANSLIGHNVRQLEKRLFTANELGERLLVMSHENDLAEGPALARHIFQMSQRQQRNYGHFAILYRMNRQSRILEEALRRVGIPYRLKGGTSFYHRKEVRDMLAYLRLVVNPHDEQALERVINLPKRGIGAVTLGKLRGWAVEKGISMWEALKRSHEVVVGRVADTMIHFSELIDGYRAELEREDAYTIARGLAERSGLLKELHVEGTPEGVSRYEHVEELLYGIEAFVKERAEEGHGLAAYLQEVALVAGEDREEEKDGPSVSLMTIHAAKGLEYAYVYIAGVEEGILPSPLMSGTIQELEEERRLFYVAITRAKKGVVLSYTLMRRHFNTYKRAKASRFIDEIDSSLLHYERVRRGAVKEKGERGYGVVVKEDLAALPPKVKRMRGVSYEQSRGDTDLRVGIEVLHAKFGRGEVLSITPSAQGDRLQVQFVHAGTKTLLRRFADLKVAESIDG